MLESFLVAQCQRLNGLSSTFLRDSDWELLQSRLMTVCDNKLGRRMCQSLEAFSFSGTAEYEFLNGVPSFSLSPDAFKRSEQAMLAYFKGLMPWRKGPFQINEFFLDSEWQCQMKWDRVKPHVDVQGKQVCDVGSGNGYFLYALESEGAAFSLGLDPMLQYYFQSLFFTQLYSGSSVGMLPFGWQDLSWFLPCFDTVLCMGVLYHQKDPLALLTALKSVLKPGGELILETLVYDSGDDVCLCPEDRYASMRNVFFIPSISVLMTWLKQSKFVDCQVLDVSHTSMAEQRVTPWSSGQSFADYVLPDGSATIEGYPPPFRAVVRASVVN